MARSLICSAAKELRQSFPWVGLGLVEIFQFLVVWVGEKGLY